MQILKRNGEKQEFYWNKISTSLENAAMDWTHPLTESDIKLLSNLVETRINKLLKYDDKRIISSLELKIILYESLKEMGFNEIAKIYMEI